MKVKNTKFTWRSFMASPAAVLLSFLLFAIVSYSLISVIPKQKKAQSAKMEAQNELQDARDQKDALKGEIGLLSSDFGREKALREKFGVVKEGEEIIVLVNNEEEQKEEKKSPFEWISQLFSS
jgi:flagellar biosynthesis/type III secretory pathway M-ring protein FliF/YscJ